MNLDDLKDQVKEHWDSAVQQVQDSTPYILAKEKYDQLTPQAQKGVIYGSIAVVVISIFMIPISSLMTASDEIDDFQDNKTLIRQLLRTSRELKQGPKVVRPISQSALQSRITSTLTSAGLVPEQMRGTQVTSPTVADLIPNNIETFGIKVMLNKLNLRQVSEIGFSLQSIDESVKMTELIIKANADDNHYYDVEYELAVFNVPLTEVADEKN